MIPPILFLRDCADPESLLLETKVQARCVIRTIAPHRCRRVELDFSDIIGVSGEFTLEFIRLAQMELPEVWLVPRHYDQGSEKLIGPLLSRLKRQREQEWIVSCELFSTGIGPRQEDGEKLS